jgi:hypothetical protein
MVSAKMGGAWTFSRLGLGVSVNPTRIRHAGAQRRLREVRYLNAKP